MIDEYVNKLRKEYEENEKKMNKNKAIIHELKLYDPEERIGRISLLSTLLYLPSFFGLYFLNIPSIIFPITVLITSFSAGTFGTYLIEKKAKCLKRFKKVSKAKNEKERIEEVLKLEMEIEKLNLRNEIIKKVCEKHNEEVKFIKKISKDDRYLFKINKSNYTKNELLNKIIILENDLIIKYQQLDNLANNSLLKRKKVVANDKMNSLFHSMIFSSMILMLCVLPILTYQIRPLPNPSIFPLISTMFFGGLTFLGSLTHFHIKRKNINNAINSINENKVILEKTNNEHEINILKSQISNILLSINTYKNEYENYDLIEEYSKIKVDNYKNVETHEYDESLSMETGQKLTLK